MDCSLFRKEVNLRDLGGYKTKDGRTIKKGCFYRSASPWYMNIVERKILKQSDIQVILDLRSKKEVARHPDPDLGIEIQNVDARLDPKGNPLTYRYRVLALMAIKELNFKIIEYCVAGFCARVVFNNGAYQRMFDFLKTGKVPFLFHCEQGKDRTGMAAILLLMALGVDEQTIISDYLLSNEYARDKIKPLRKHRFLIAASKNYDDLTMVAEGVIPIGAISAINSVKERYGTIEAYLEKEMNMSLQDIETMRNTYLE